MKKSLSKIYRRCCINLRLRLKQWRSGSAFSRVKSAWLDPVVSAFQIRKVCQDVIECEDDEEPVKNLTKILLKDFDERYQPVEGRKVKYFREETLGRGKRCVGLHHYFFFESFLDPRTLPTLKEYFMTNEDYEQLNSLITSWSVIIALIHLKV